jgi:hypothetical protein
MSGVIRRKRSSWRLSRAAICAGHGVVRHAIAMCSARWRMADFIEAACSALNDKLSLSITGGRNDT